MQQTERYWLGEISRGLAYFVKGYDEFQICHKCGNGLRHKDHYEIDVSIKQIFDFGQVYNLLTQVQICAACFEKAHGGPAAIPNPVIDVEEMAK